MKVTVTVFSAGLIKTKFFPQNLSYYPQISIIISDFEFILNLF